MKNVFLGEYVKQRRLDLGLTQEQLCDGICEPMTLSRLENGKQTPSRNRINALLQRLGLPDDRYFALLSKNELEMEALKKEIVACNVTEKVPEGFEKLAQFEKLADPDDQISQQFALCSRVLLGRLDVRIVKSVASAVADVSCPTKSISKSAVHMKKKFFLTS